MHPVITRLIAAVRPLWLLTLSLGIFNSQAQATEVLATIRPLALIAHAVVLDPAQVRILIPSSASAHHPVLRPSNRVDLLNATIVLRVGPAHDAFLDKAITARKGITISAQQLPGITLLTTRYRDGLSPKNALIDPHLWLLPDNAQVIAQALAKTLAQQDPARAAQYQQRANQFSEKMQKLKQDLTRTTTKPYIAWHDAYHYLEPLLHLQFRGSLTLDDDNKPSAKHFQWMADRIQQEKISCILTEPGFDIHLVKRLAGNQPLKTVAVDEMLAYAPLNADGYEKGLRDIAQKVGEGCW